MSGITNKSRIVIYGWMINELDIYNTDELIIYALYYGASKNKFNYFIDEEYIESVFSLPFHFLKKSVNNLIEQGLLEYEDQENLKEFGIYAPRLRAVVPRGAIL